MAVSEQLIEQTTRHQVYLERLKSGEVNQFAAYLKQIDESIRRRLSGKDLTDYTRKRLERLLVSLEQDLKEIYSAHYDELSRSLLDIANYEAEFEAKSLNEVLTNFETVIPASAQINAAVFSKPLSVRGADGGKLLESFIEDWSNTDIKRVSGAIRQGFFEGQTTSQILQVVRGTRANKYRDGILAISNRNAEAIVRTAVQHAATVAREQTWSKNSTVVKGVRWVSTLDSHTSAQCRSLDGTVFPIDKGPRPPIHINCLSGDTDVLSRSRVANAYKRRYEGRVIEIRTQAGRHLTITPNHPILTRAGWKAAGEINRLDELAAIPNPRLIKGNEKDCVVAKFSEIFAAANVSADAASITDRPAAPKDFHGDGTDGNVSIVNIDGFAWDRIRELLGKDGVNQWLVFRARVENALFSLRSLDSFCSGVLSASSRFVRGLGKLGNLLRSGALHSRVLLFTSVAQAVAPIGQVFFDRGGADTELLSNTKNTNARLKQRDDAVGINILKGALMFGWDRNALSGSVFVNGMNANTYSLGSFMGWSSACNKLKSLSNKLLLRLSSFSWKPQNIKPFVKSGFTSASDSAALLNGSAGLVEFDSVIECRFVDFCGHVYNLENEENWYLANGIITHNCRSSVVAELDGRFDFLKEGATRASQDGPVDASETYYSWLKRQPAEFQDSVIGPTRGKLLRDGGLTAERFAELNLGRNFEPLTLDEMRRLDKDVFDKAFGGIVRKEQERRLMTHDELLPIVERAEADGYSTFGVRRHHKKVAVGDELENSKNFIDDQPTEDLNGVSAVDVGYDGFEMVDYDWAVKQLESYGHNNGDYILVGGDDKEYGNDDGEIIIINPVVLAIIKQ